MAEIPVPEGYGVPLVDLITFRLPEPTMQVIEDLAADPATIEQAVEDYLTANPPAAGISEATLLSSQSAQDAATALALGGKAPLAHGHAQGDVVGLTGDLAGKAPIAHQHTSSEITDFREAVEDAVAALLAQGTNVTLAYTDNGSGPGSLVVSSTGGTGGGTDLEAVMDTLGVALVGIGVVSVAYDDNAVGGRGTITITSTATQNDTDANLKNRSNHTGTQLASTVTETATLKWMTDVERAKLAGIASGATANRADSATDALIGAKADAAATTAALGTKADTTALTAGLTAEASLRTISDQDLKAWAAFLARVPDIATTGCRLLWKGSSTIYNVTQPETDRVVYKFSNMLTLAVGTTTPATVQTLAAAVAAPPSGPGVHSINAGVSGSQSGGGTPYSDATTRAQEVALLPDLIIHDIGPNDFGNGISVATFKANIIAVLADYDAKGYKKGHLFIHQHERMDAAAQAAKVAPWSAYLQALQEIAATRTDMSVIDISGFYQVIDADATDPYDFLGDSDLIHLTPNGYSFMARVLQQVLIGGPIDNTPNSSTATTTRTLTPISSDSGAGAAGSIGGTAQDLFAGGVAGNWTTSAANAIARSGSGRFVNGSVTNTAGFEYRSSTDTADILATHFKMHGNVANNVFGYAARAGTSGTVDGIMFVTAGTTVQLRQIVSTVATLLGTAKTFALGDDIGVEYQRSTGKARLLINGVVVDEQTTGVVIPSTYYHGIAYGSARVNLSLSEYRHGPVTYVTSGGDSTKVDKSAVAGLNTVGWGRAVFIANGGTVPVGTPAYTIVIEAGA